MSSLIKYCLGFSILFLLSCEDVIDVQLQEVNAGIVVDAWVDNMERDQVITLTRSQAYFDSNTPASIVGAQIELIRDDGSVFNFEDTGGGMYVWESNGATLGAEGADFKLVVSAEGTTIEGISELRRVPAIDSIGFEFRDDELFSDDGIYAQFFARDPIGKGDTYWIKTYRNDQYLARPEELNIAFDAGFDGGSGVDGIIFIPPIREFVNQLDEDDLPTPLEVGESLRVELHAISNDGFDFLEIARDQITNGNNGIFSIPQANARTNLTSSSEVEVLGFFNVANVSSVSRTVE